MARDPGVAAVVQTRLDARVFSPPADVALRRGPFGLGLFAVRPFRRGEVIYRAEEFEIPDDDRVYRATVLIEDEAVQVDITSTHTVRYNGHRTFDIPGCFMNHSCDPSSVSRDTISSDGSVSYEQVALRDLVPGDEITCNYVLFDWDCDGHRFQCSCGAEGCLGFIGGFGSLPPAIQDRLATQTYYEAERMWRLTQG